MHGYCNSCIWFFFPLHDYCNSCIWLFFLSPASDSHLNSLFLISSQLSLSLISTLFTALSFSHLNSTLQSQLASSIISTCSWTHQRHSAHMKTTGSLGEPWSSDLRPWRFQIRRVLAGASLPSCCSDLWLLGFDPFFIICLISGFWDFIWLGWMGWWWWLLDDGGWRWWLCGCSIWSLIVAGS